ncbi:hypothetical protein VTK73DRAFT_8541 [Phialemonium thermophilum]|uniref:Secreted protein n=1 Tax=Phialemonium thermophilum TaxID=223376 RepID=A0ABR3W8J3_9PEZI
MVRSSSSSSMPSMVIFLSRTYCFSCSCVRPGSALRTTCTSFFSFFPSVGQSTCACRRMLYRSSSVVSTTSRTFSSSLTYGSSDSTSSRCCWSAMTTRDSSGVLSAMFLRSLATRPSWITDCIAATFLSITSSKRLSSTVGKERKWTLLVFWNSESASPRYGRRRP